MGALGGIANLRGRHDEALRSAEKVLRHSRLAGRQRTALLLLEYALVYGPCPADEAIRVLDESLPGTSHPGPLLHRSLLLAMLDRFEDAWSTARESSGRARALSGNSQAQFLAQIATLAGDHVAAAECWREHCDLLERHGDRAALSTAAPLLGRSLCALGRHSEAEPFAQLGLELGDPSDIVTQALWRQLEAVVLVSRGESVAAQNLAREAVELTDRTDCLNLQGDALCDLAEVLAGGGSETRPRQRSSRHSTATSARRISQCSRRFARSSRPCARRGCPTPALSPPHQSRVRREQGEVRRFIRSERAGLA